MYWLAIGVGSITRKQVYQYLTSIHPVYNSACSGVQFKSYMFNICHRGKKAKWI